MKRTIMLLIAFIACTACGSKELYHSSQGWRQNECQKIIENEERVKCMEAANKSYEQYQKERNETIKSQ